MPIARSGLVPALRTSGSLRAATWCARLRSRAAGRCAGRDRPRRRLDRPPGHPEDHLAAAPPPASSRSRCWRRSRWPLPRSSSTRTSPRRAARWPASPSTRPARASPVRRSRSPSPRRRSPRGWFGRTFGTRTSATSRCCATSRRRRRPAAIRPGAPLRGCSPPRRRRGRTTLLPCRDGCRRCSTDSLMADGRGGAPDGMASPSRRFRSGSDSRHAPTPPGHPAAATPPPNPAVDPRCPAASIFSPRAVRTRLPRSTPCAGSLPSLGPHHDHNDADAASRAHPLRHLGQQLLSRLADLGARRSEHRPVRRRVDEPHPVAAGRAEEFARLPGHRLDDPLALEVLDRAAGRRVHGPPRARLPRRAGLRHRPAGRAAGRRRGRDRQGRGRRLHLRPHQRLAGRRVPRAPRARAHARFDRRVGQLRLRPRHRQVDDGGGRQDRAQVPRSIARRSTTAPSCATSSTSKPRPRACSTRCWCRSTC